MIKRISILSIVFAFLAISCSIARAKDAGLSYLIKDNKPVKVFVKGFVNESGQSQIIPNNFKKTFEEAVLNRKSVTFELAKSPDKSDVQISGVIKKYLYSKNDPVTSYGSPTILLLDAATSENYVEMAAEFTIVDTKTGKTVWRDTVSTFIKRAMTPEESIPLIYEKLSRNFLWKSFGRQR